MCPAATVMGLLLPLCAPGEMSGVTGARSFRAPGTRKGKDRPGMAGRPLSPATQPRDAQQAGTRCEPRVLNDVARAQAQDVVEAAVRHGDVQQARLGSVAV